MSGKLFVDYIQTESNTITILDYYGRMMMTVNPNSVYSNGNFTIATSLGVGTSPSGTTGQIRASGSIVASYSDKRLKTDIKVIDNALEKVNHLSGITFTQNELAESLGLQEFGSQTGVLAQDVLEVIPEAVKPAPFDINENNESISGENYLTVQYEKLVPLLIESIKELSLKVETLSKKIKELEG